MIMNPDMTLPARNKHSKLTLDTKKKKIYIGYRTFM